MDYLFWAILLLAAGAGLLVLELFIPSGGVLSIFAGITILIGLLLAYFYSPAMGLLLTVLATFSTPLVGYFMIKLWPRTPIGRRMLMQGPDDELAEDEDAAQEIVAESLVGKLATARSVMLPSGAIELEGRVLDAMSAGMPIEIGQTVRIVEVHGSRIIVRPVGAAPPAKPAAAGSQQPTEEEDPLSKPLDSLGIDLESDPFQ